ncbi:MAG: endo-1,4-beta-xylanase, partial [Clostridia bacterium]|nr:endo-1,4-beta-xylanase [Clostridia bacterium]
LSRMKEHIKTVVSRYRSRVAVWDVLNEVLRDEGGLRESRWYRIAGEDYIPAAFFAARDTAPIPGYDGFDVFLHPGKKQLVGGVGVPVPEEPAGTLTVPDEGVSPERDPVFFPEPDEFVEPVEKVPVLLRVNVQGFGFVFQRQDAELLPDDPAGFGFRFQIPCVDGRADPEPVPEDLLQGRDVGRISGSVCQLRHDPIPRFL